MGALSVLAMVKSAAPRPGFWGGLRTPGALYGVCVHRKSRKGRG